MFFVCFTYLEPVCLFCFFCVSGVFSSVLPGKTCLRKHLLRLLCVTANDCMLVNV